MPPQDRSDRREEVVVPAAVDTPGLYDRLLHVLDGQTFAGIAAATGVPAETVRRYLSERGDPPREFLAAVAARYGCSVEWLLHGRGDGGPRNG